LKNTYTTIQIKIIVINANNHASQFDLAVYLVTVPRNITGRTKILTLKATDGDVGQNSRVTYLLNPPSITGRSYFDINPLTGDLFVTGTGCGSYADSNLTILAVNGGNVQLVGSTIVQITFDDSIPQSKSTTDTPLVPNTTRSGGSTTASTTMSSIIDSNIGVGSSTTTGSIGSNGASTRMYLMNSSRSGNTTNNRNSSDTASSSRTDQPSISSTKSSTDPASSNLSRFSRNLFTAGIRRNTQIGEPVILLNVRLSFFQMISI